MSKYTTLWRYLKVDGRISVELSFDEIANILGLSIDHSFLSYKKEAKDYGYIMKKISLKDKKVIFVKI